MQAGSSSETIAMKNSQYNTAGACLKWFYAAHQVVKLTVCIKACFVTLQNYKFGLWQKTKQRMALDRPIDQTNKTVKKSQLPPLYFQSWQVFALPTVWPFHVAQQIRGQNR